MANVNVTFSEMQSEANQLVTEKTEIQQRLSTLKQRIQNLTESGFVTDQASVRFNEMYQKFTQDADQTIEVLTDISNFLNDSARAMQETDEALARAINY